MEEIRLDKSDEINIPIHRAQFYDEEDGTLDETTINDKVEPAQNLTSPSTDENDDSKEKQARSSKRTSSSEGIEELHLDQSINDEKEYIFPAINLLARPVRKGKFVSDKTLKETALKLQETLESFGVGVTVMC